MFATPGRPVGPAVATTVRPAVFPAVFPTLSKYPAGGIYACYTDIVLRHYTGTKLFYG
jgi:hypothetical protein